MNLDKKQGCTLHFISLVDETMATTPLPTVTSVWDVIECVRQSRSSRGKYLQQLLDHCYQRYTCVAIVTVVMTMCVQWWFVGENADIARVHYV